MDQGARELEAHRSVRPGERIEVVVERILPGGASIAHHGKQTVMVGLAAPGDHLRVRVERVRKGLVFASILEVLKPSPLRVEPPCPYFGRCGGCDFQQLSYAAQLEAKVEIIRDCLRRIARMETHAEIPITPSPLEWRYRARAQWQHDARQSLLGYFERGSHRVCDIVECPVLVPELQELLSGLREQMQRGALALADEDFKAVAGDEGTSLASPVQTGAAREVSRTILEDRYHFSAESFFQINQSLLPALVAAALRDARGSTALDLYCGVGLFTLPLARRFKHVTGVEANPSAADCARRNLADAQLTNATIECKAVGEWLSTNARRHAPLDLVLLDPPRAGLEEGAVAGLARLQPQRITYVSCDPATLARDLGQLLAAGYALDTIAAFDMFPQTHHVETVAHLELMGL